MNVCLITPWRTRCGIATYSEALAEGLAEEGCKVYVTRVHRFSVKDEKYFETLAVRRIPKCDVIHVQHEYGIFAGMGLNLEEGLYRYLKMHQTPVVTTMHCTGVRRDVDQSIVEGSDEVVVHNKWMKEQLGYKAKIIPHGCKPCKPVEKESARQLLGLKKDAFICASFGVLSQYKGLEEVFEALRAVPDTFLLITGGWHVEVQVQYIEQMKRLAERILPNRVSWLGWVSADKLPIIFGASDIGIINHRFASESGALLTALGYGKCMITSSHPAFKEKEPVLMTNEGVEDLAKKLRMLKENPSLIEEYEEKAKEYANQVSWRETAKRHIELYQDLV